MRKKIISLIACVVSFVAGTGITSLFSDSNGLVPDLFLIHGFEVHHSELDTLAKMVREDPQVQIINSSYLLVRDNLHVESLTYWSKDEPWPKTESAFGFTKERWDEYKKILDSLGPDYSINRNPERSDAIFFVASYDSSDLDGSEFLVIEKGYVYSDKDINYPIVDSLDNIKSDLPAIFFKKLSDHWYLYFESSIGKPE